MLVYLYTSSIHILLCKLIGNNSTLLIYGRRIIWWFIFLSTGSNDSSRLSDLETSSGVSKSPQEKPTEGWTWYLLKKAKIVDVNDQVDFKVLGIYIVVGGIVVVVIIAGFAPDMPDPKPLTPAEEEVIALRWQYAVDLAKKYPRK